MDFFVFSSVTLQLRMLCFSLPGSLDTGPYCDINIDVLYEWNCILIVGFSIFDLLFNISV